VDDPRAVKSVEDLEERANALSGNGPRYGALDSREWTAGNDGCDEVGQSLEGAVIEQGGNTGQS
jgi:hypothetical protein